MNKETGNREGKLKKQIREVLEEEFGFEYGFGVKEDCAKVLDEAHEELTFNESEPMWKDYLSADAGMTGDYPDTGDFLPWLVDEVKKLLVAKKKWFGEV